MFAAHFGDGAAFGLSIDYVQEDVPLDTGGGIRNAASSLRGGGAADPVVVLNADTLSGHDLVRRSTCTSDPRRGNTASGRGGGPVPVRRRADRWDRTGDGVPGEDAGPGDQPDQRRVLRVPARGHRPDPGRPPGVGRAGDVPRADRGRGARHGLSRVGVLARRRDAAGVRARLVRSGARAAASSGVPARPVAAADGGLVAADASCPRDRLWARARRWRGATVDGSVCSTARPLARAPWCAIRILGRGAIVAPGAALDQAVVGDGAYIGGNQPARASYLAERPARADLRSRFFSDA